MRLEDRLAELAQDAPHPVAGPDLWRRGSRWGRRRRGGTVLVALAGVLALLVLVAPAPWTSWSVAPPAADTLGTTSLPDTFYGVGRWLPGTRGPVGPLSAVTVADRGSWSDLLVGRSRSGVVGISAAGDYRFLDLPGLADEVPVRATEGAPALSADGTMLAYWYVGRTGRPTTSRYGPAYAGVAVWDAVTGDLLRLPLPGDQGVRGFQGVRGSEILWSGHRVWLTPSAGDTGRGGGATSEGTTIWSPRSDDVDTLERTWSIGEATDASGSLLVNTVLRLEILSPPAPGRSVPLSRVWSTDRLGDGPAYLSPDGSRVAVLEDGDGRASTSGGGPEALLVGTLVADIAQVDLRRTTSERWVAVVGWRDDDHVVAVRDAAGGLTFDSVDVRTGEARVLSVGESWPGHPPTVAEDAWRAPLLIDAPPPPSPLDPRLRLGLAALVLVAGVGGVATWRRHDRP